ncbi:hypothetical protein [Dorea sp.]
MTISGGEVLMQAEFARDIVVSNERIKENLMKADREFAGDIHIRIPEIRHSQKRTACVMICSDDNKEELI